MAFFIFLLVLLAGGVLGYGWRARQETVALSDWQVYMASLETPHAIVTAEQGDILYANAACVDTFSLVDSQQQFKTATPRQQQAVQAFILAQPWPQPFSHVDAKVRAPGANRVRVNVQLSGLPIRCRGKRAWVVSLSSTDQRTHWQLHEQEQGVLLSVINSLEELVCFQDVEGNVVGTNAAFDRFWQGREQEAIVWQADQPLTQPQTERTWATQHNDESCLLETNITALKNDKQAIIGTLCISHDVTNWHQMQERLQKEAQQRQSVEQVLEQRSHLLSAIFKSSIDPIGIYDQDYYHLACNQAYADALGTTIEALENAPAQKVVDPDIFDQHRQRDQQVLDTGETMTYEDVILGQSGEQTWYEVAKSRIQDPVTGDPAILLMARDITERKETQQQLADAIMALQALSFVDSLTQVANRRSLDEQLSKLWRSQAREGTPLAFILCDIDHFKLYNDHYGHQQGDWALQKVANALTSAVHRPLDVVARYGGEEFAIILPQTELNGAIQVAETARERVLSADIAHHQAVITGKITISLGVACVTPTADGDYGDLIQQADRALYQAKRNGRNQVSVVKGMPTPHGSSPRRASVAESTYLESSG
ncbi:hypothetical protein BZG80_14735 [Salinivibrio sp. MA440]|uniref:diguanylate cyclase domain-containing protein n=1 Tax=Salinivibrio sp. MA440 TaxID=1909456 RepID=UPI0009890CBF|nr:diguanylate cyclase [Salinivibrio sp. MA440]OOF01751.1 hypothetical protein BZG80_14735 [Salinivibrio sp. MA440]